MDDQMLSRLSPQILKLQSQSRAPITVYILNSPGGQTAAMQAIVRLLKLGDRMALLLAISSLLSPTRLKAPPPI